MIDIERGSGNVVEHRAQQPPELIDVLANLTSKRNCPERPARIRSRASFLHDSRFAGPCRYLRRMQSNLALLHPLRPRVQEGDQAQGCAGRSNDSGQASGYVITPTIQMMSSPRVASRGRPWISR
ncbi:hypothetical protein [Burkholderia sp. lig30]|uniref:hypothetical protein n=1 Tax=Burkholderia sp. lig30 TaxID=1192124 RepID=UPI00128F9028|nr:hypothetical protein [Burkholderia sp. lig30]